MPELSNFLNSLEFCNAVVQVAHKTVQDQLLAYLHQGFLEPVLAPALAQPEAPAAPTAYLHLLLGAVSEPRLLHVFLKFLATGTHEGARLLDLLVARLGAPGRLGLVSMSLFHTLLDLDCEDIMLELVFKFLLSCSHIMVSQRSRVCEVDMYGATAEKFLSFVPLCCASVPPEPPPPSRMGRSPSTTSFAYGDFDHNPNITTPARMHHHIPHTAGSSYLQYIHAAHNSILRCCLACQKWTGRYDGCPPSSPPERLLLLNGGREDEEEEDEDFWHLLDSTSTPSSSSPAASELDDSLDMYELPCCSLDSGVGWGSADPPPTVLPATAALSSVTVEVRGPPPDIGPFLNVLLGRLEMMPHNEVYLNLQLTGLVTRLALYPQPLLRSFLLNHMLVFQPTVRSLFQVLGSLKLKMDNLSKSVADFPGLLLKARRFLAGRVQPPAPAPSGRVGIRRSYSIDTVNHRGEPSVHKRRSLVDMLFKKPDRTLREPILESTSDGLGYRFIANDKEEEEDEEESEVEWRAVLCAVVLEEFLRELAAIAQEHGLIQLDPPFWLGH